MNRILAGLLLVGLVLLSACGKSPKIGNEVFEVESLFISPTSAELALGSEYQFYAVAVDKEGIPQKVAAVWSVYSRVGTIDAGGKYRTATTAGHDYVAARYGSFQANAYVTVKPGAIASMRIEPAVATLEVGDSCSFTIAGEDAFGNAVDVSPSWTASGGIGSISEDYYYSSVKGIKCSSTSYSDYVYFTANAAGTSTLTAKYCSIEATASVQVLSPAPYHYSFSWLTKVGSTSAIPRCLTVAADGGLWVGMYVYDSSSAEAYQGSVYKYDATGNILVSLEALVSGEGRLQSPNDIAFDASGNIYVVDYYGDRIRKYDSAGNFLLAWGDTGDGSGQFSYPARIAIDNNNNLFITDSGNNRVQKFDSSGNFKLAWGSYGAGDGQFNCPTGIIVDGSGNLYVADKENNRIQKFDGNGGWLAKIGSSGRGVGQLYEPVGLALDADENIYVADYGNARVCVFDKLGKYLYKWGSSGSATGRFSGLIDLGIDSSGNVYSVETYNYRVQKFIK